MVSPIKSIRINAVDHDTSIYEIIKTFDKYAEISNVYMDEFETRLGAKYCRVYFDIDKWYETTAAKDLVVSLLQTGRARLNYWWDIQDNTNQKIKYRLH